MKLKQLLEQYRCWHNWKTINREIIVGEFTEQVATMSYRQSEYLTIKRKCVCEKCAKIKIFKL